MILIVFFCQNLGDSSNESKLRCIRHHKVSSEPFFLKHQFALMDHNIFMKQIGSIVDILNHSDFFLRTFLCFCGFLEFFPV